jgi:hypothetical protein
VCIFLGIGQAKDSDMLHPRHSRFALTDTRATLPAGELLGAVAEGEEGPSLGLGNTLAQPLGAGH